MRVPPRPPRGSCYFGTASKAMDRVRPPRVGGGNRSRCASPRVLRVDPATSAPRRRRWTGFDLPALGEVIEADARPPASSAWILLLRHRVEGDGQASTSPRWGR